MSNKEIPTYYRFNANIRKFTDNLKSDPIHAEPSDLLKEYGFDRDKLIRVLIKRNIIRRKESIKDQTNSDYKKPTYIVRYTVIGDNFEEKTEQMYKDYIKKCNTFPKKKINEEGEGGAMSAGEPQGATNAESSGQYDVPFLATGKSVTGNVINKPIGKIAEDKKKRRVFMTESQMKGMKYILNEISVHDKYELERKKGVVNMPFERYDEICSLDPTTKPNKAGKYCNWLLQHVTDDVDLQALRIALEQFNDGMKRGILQREGIPSDIGQFRTCEDLISVIQSVMKSDEVQFSNSEVNNMKRLEGQYEVYLENKDWLVIAPKTWEAERYFGRETSWCTVGNDFFFERYMKQGQLYINYPKNGDLEKRSQFHFESGSFADVKDDVVKNPKESLVGILGEDRDFYSLCSLWSKDERFNKYKYVKFSEVQELLDNGEDPEEIFYWVGGLQDGWRCVYLNGKYNFINEYNKLIMPDIWFDYSRPFDDGTATVGIGKKYNFVRDNGTLVWNKPIKEWFDDVFNFENRFAIVELDGKWNFIDTEGHLISPNQWFEGVNSFYNNHTCVKLNGRLYITDKNGILYDYNTKQPLPDSQQPNLNIKQEEVINESEKKHRIYITESQLCELLNGEDENIEEATDCGSVGAFAYDANAFGRSKKKGNGFWKDAMSRPKGGISVTVKR